MNSWAKWFILALFMQRRNGFTCFLFSTRQTTISNKALGLDFTESPCEMLWLDKLCVWRLKGSELGAVQLFAVCSDAHRRRDIGIMSTGSCVYRLSPSGPEIPHSSGNQSQHSIPTHESGQKMRKTIQRSRDICARFHISWSNYSKLLSDAAVMC